MTAFMIFPVIAFVGIVAANICGFVGQNNAGK
jgi:hypothetical protein